MRLPLIAIMQAGHWIEMSSVLSASSALEELAQLMPSESHRKNGEDVDDVPMEEVPKGDILLIKSWRLMPSCSMSRRKNWLTNKIHSLDNRCR
jgi:P-type Cu2+ transporter